VTLNNGTVLKGFARSRSIHDVLLQTLDGKLHSLNETEYRQVSHPPCTMIRGRDPQALGRSSCISRTEGAIFCSASATGCRMIV